MTTQTTPAGATHWSTRKLAAQLGISDTTVLKVWHANGLKPHLVETFKVSRDPKFVEKLEDIVALYTSPSEPRLDGLVATRQIRALPDYRDIPILAMTANAFTEDKARCLEDGMDDSLIKPFDPDMLFSTLLKYFERRSVGRDQNADAAVEH